MPEDAAMLHPLLIYLKQALSAKPKTAHEDINHTT